ncbi:hypothetical protein BKA70DRAFT_1419378 [Coprinopsis sp. MPI-PUGE-AT-0042]|nr:hypothetical protein BKA70DRAFT_1419378 [Coprinopsis sp. MPI-PUGE-AT-0042]
MSRQLPRRTPTFQQKMCSTESLCSARALVLHYNRAFLLMFLHMKTVLALVLVLLVKLAVGLGLDHALLVLAAPTLSFTLAPKFAALLTSTSSRG